MMFSVIVPEHNSAAWMRKGLDSIRRQTFTDYELIVVCDACDGNEAEIAREYTDKVIEVDFRSSGKTRNAGLDAATGDWILFMDDDDWWMDDRAFEKIAAAVGDEIDILAFAFEWKGRGIVKQHHGCLFIAVWNKAWRRDFIGDTRFPEVPHSDDVGFAEATHSRATRIAYLFDALYYYNYLRPGSISQKLQSGELQTLEEMGLIE